MRCSGIPVNCATRLKIGAMLPGFSGPPQKVGPLVAEKRRAFELG
jgi:hypothetical protein